MMQAVFNPNSVEAAILDSFRFLVQSFGFEHVKSKTTAPEMYVRFENATTAAIVSIEIGSPPWVALGRLELRNGKVVDGERYSLGFLRSLRRAPDPIVEIDKNSTLDQIKERLDEEAVSLKRDAVNILRGDFSSFPALKELAERNYEKRTRKLFGDE